MLLDIKLKHNLTYPISITDAGKCSYCFQRQVSDLLLGVIKELQYRIHYLIGIKLVLVYRAQEALDQQIKKFFTNVPIWTVVQIGKDERDEIVLLFQTASHYLHYAEQTSDGFLPDNIFAIS